MEMKIVLFHLKKTYSLLTMHITHNAYSLFHHTTRCCVSLLSNSQLCALYIRCWSYELCVTRRFEIMLNCCVRRAYKRFGHECAKRRRFEIMRELCEISLTYLQNWFWRFAVVLCKLLSITQIEMITRIENPKLFLRYNNMLILYKIVYFKM
jgi:hypothetical protein